MRLLVCALCIASLVGCASMSKFTSYNANALYRRYLAKDETVASLDGKIVHVEGTISRIDQSKLNDVFIELNSRVIVLLKDDEVSKISQIGLKNGDYLRVVGNFEGEGVLSKWLTNANNRVLVVDEGQIIDKEHWYDLKNFENPLFYFN